MTADGRPVRRCRWAAVAAGVLLSLGIAAQPFLVTGGSDNTCAGAFLDSGGQGATGYTNNEDDTYTLCPDVPGSLISLSFVTFNLSLAGVAPVDNLTIYDGPNTAAPLLGSFTGTSLQGQTISASTGNASGCLTFVWHSNNTGTGVFAASIHCFQPCTPPVAAATMTQAAPARVCMGTSVNFDGSGSTAQPGYNLVSWTWDFNDGTTTTSAVPTIAHTFTDPGVHTVQLTVTDNNGCASVNRIDLQVWVGTPPTFTGTGGITTGCAGEQLCLDGVVNPTPYVDEPETTYGNGVFVPDDVGSCFEAQLYLTQFAPGATLTNINQLLGLCMNIEHSWLGDLVITITSPSGQSVILHQQGIIQETLLGEPVDPDEANPQPGTCAQYCFANTSPNGNMAAYANANGSGFGWELPPGTYQSLSPLTGLVGSQLNGLWTLTICDMWQLDNGFLCDWNIDLDPSLYANAISYTPQYGAGCDSTWWTGPGILSTGPGCEQICLQQATAGTYNYVYHAVDDFGCSYDTTIVVTITPPIVVDAGANTSICEGGSTLLNGSVISGGLPPQPCTYQLDLLDSFGDGWDGAVIGIVINGVEQDWTLPNGSSGSVTINVEHGDAITLIYYPSVLFNNEHAYNLYDGQGNLVFADTPPFPNGTTWSGVVDCGPPPAFIYSWSPATGLSATNIAAPTATPGTTTTYTLTVSQAGHPACTGTDQVTVTVVPPVNAGTDAQITVCANSAPFDMFALLGGAPMTGGTWTGPGGATTGSTFTPGTSAPGTYTYSVNGVAPCPGVDQATVTVTVNQPVDAGTDATITVCANDATAALLPLLGGAQAGGSWTDPGGAPSNGTFSPGTSAPGVYTYTLIGNAPCPNDQATVTITENQPVDAGTDATLTVCANDATAALLPLLGGAQAGGSWTDPDGAPSNGTFSPGTSTPGVYTYTLTGTAPCPNDQATVTVTENQPVDAGTDATLTACANDATAALLPLLGGAQAGGSWTDPGGANSNGTFSPGTSTPGVYTYTLTGTAPCPNDQATVTVTENQPVDAGTDATLTVCANDATAALLPLLVGAQAGGAWTDPGGAPSNGTFSPGTSAPGVYTYTLIGTAPCPNDQATVTVTENQPVDAGTDATLTVCANDATAALLPLLGGAQAGGTWTEPGGATSNGTFTPGTSTPGVYTYTLTGTAPCPNDQATVTITENQPVDAGTDATLTVCANDATAALLPLLGGAQAGGTWTDPSGAPSNGTFTPGTSTPGVYTYTLTGTAPCPNDQTTVTIAENQPVDAGADGSITLCSSGTPVDLFASLGGAQPGGSWSFNGSPHGNSFDPSVDAGGQYTYVVTGTAPCPNDQAEVIVSVNQQPDAGADGATILCISSPSIDLFAELGGDPEAGGTWTFGGATHGNVFTPGSDLPGTYIYTVMGAAPCPTDQATVDVTVTTQPDPGTSGTITVCANDASFDLFTVLGGTPDLGGTWSANGAPHENTFVPGTDAPGVYTYIITVPPPCANVSATVTVDVVQPPDAGTDGDALLCISGPALDLFAELSGAQAGGSWSFNAAPHGNLFTPGLDAAGAYIYTIPGIAPCPNDQSAVTVAVTNDPDPGMNSSITLCANAAAIDLFAYLDGTPDPGGSWSINGAPHTGTFDPATETAGVYTYTVDVPPPCTSQSATVTVMVVQPANAGADGDALLCVSGTPLPLFGELSGAQTGGTWTFNGAPHGGTFDPGTDAAGVYTYTVVGVTPCPDDQSNVTVAVTTDPDPGTDGSITLCASAAAADLFTALGGTPDAGGSWSFNGAPHSGQMDPAGDAAGVYTYTVNAPPPCTSQSATVTVNIVQPPDAGADGDALLCISSPPIDLFTELAGADAGGSWSFNGVPHGNTFSPGTDATGAYTYTVAGIAPCPADEATVTVSVTNNPEPGTNGALVVCASGAPIDLFAQLGGTPDAGGTWSVNGTPHGGMFDPAIDAAGVYTYTITVPPPCTNASSTITVLVQAPPEAGQDGALTVCTTSPTATLIDALTGAQPGGNWTFAGAPHAGSFAPGSDAPGNYSYTVTGTSPCPDDQATVVVTVNAPPDAGEDGTLSVCSTDDPMDLFALLGGTPDAGGTWSVDGASHSASYDPGNDVPGIYTYTLSGTAPCPGDAATVTVGELAPPDAGLDGTLSACAAGAGIDLFAELGGTPDTGGTWSGPSAVSNGQFDPGTMQPGIYTYLVTGTAPCANDAAQVNVSVTSPPDPGGDGALLLCTGSPAVDLFGQLSGTPDPGGAWTYDGAPHNGSFDPAVDANGIYTYTVNGTAPCPSASATVTMTVTSTPDAGLPGNATLCSSAAALPLLGLLGGTPDAGGVWTDPNGAAHGALFDPANDPPGTYTYAINVPPPCVSTSSTVTIALVEPADPGSGGSVDLCSTSAVVDLDALLGGSPDPDGEWSFNGILHGDQVDPGIDASGIYTYTVAGTAPCPSVDAEVQVTIHAPPDAGGNGSVTLCASSPALDLFAELAGSPQSGGSWTFNGAPHGAFFDPAVDLSGTLTYTVPGIAPCPADTSTVLVNVVSAPDPGTDGSVTLCANGSAVVLFEQLGGTPDNGGAWSGPSPVVGGLFEPGSMAPGTYTYTIDVPAPCTSVQSQVVVAVQSMPDAGSDGSAVLCASAAASDLFTVLGGAPQPGGSWTGPDGQPQSSLFNPATDLPGAYTYTVAGTWPCPSASVQVLMAVTAEPDPGWNGATSLCADGSAIDLFAQLGGTPDVGGSWTGPSVVQGGVFDPATMQPGLYTYTLNVPPPCQSASSQVLISVVQPPDPGTDGATVLCSTDGVMDLFAWLGGTPDPGGSWSVNGFAHSANFDPAADPSGVYTYTVQGTPPCTAATATVVTEVVLPPDAGADNTLTLCPDGAPADLFTALGGSPDAGGTWSAPGGAAMGGLFDPAVDQPGMYTYTVNATAPCANDQAAVVVSVPPAIQATTTVIDAVCHNSCDGSASLQVSGGTPDYTFQWSGGGAGQTDVSATGLCAGAYAIIITDAIGCKGLVELTIGQPPPLVIDAVLATGELCPGQCDGTATVVDAEGVLFSADGGLTWQGTPAFAGLCAGSYMLMMQDANGCLASATASVASPPPVIAAFTAVEDTVITGSTSVDFMNQSAFATSFFWDFAGLGTSTEGEPSFTFPDVLDGTYTVCLTAMNANGCVDTTCHPILVLGELIVHVPNAFTPNDDSMNEGFRPVFNNPQNVADYDLLVFDRWGELIFESRRVGETWDGRMSGELVKEDVYVWKLHFRDLITRKKHDLIGHVTLLK